MSKKKVLKAILLVLSVLLTAAQSLDSEAEHHNSDPRSKYD